MINKEVRKDLEEAVMNKLVYFISMNINSEHIEAAEAQFNMQLTENKYSIEESEFTPWLIWEYKINNQSIIDLFLETEHNITEDEKKLLVALKGTYVSIYDNYKVKNDEKYKDIFTGKDFVITDMQYETENKLIMGRLYTLEGNTYMFNDCYIIESKYKNGIEKSFYNNYEEYKRKDANIDKVEFLKKGYLFLISIINIIFNVNVEDTDDDRLYVYQSDYAVKEYDKVVQLLEGQDVVEYDDSINGQKIYILYKTSDRVDVVAELVLSNRKLEIESVIERDRTKAKNFVDRLLSDKIVHMGDKLVTMEDL